MAKTSRRSVGNNIDSVVGSILGKGKDLDRGNTYLNLARKYQIDCELDKAIYCFEKYLEIGDSTNIQAQSELATCYSENGEINKAIEIFKAVIEYPEVSNDQGDKWIVFGSYYVALQADENPYLQLATCYHALGKDVIAEDYYLKALEKDPSWVGGYAGLASLYQGQGKTRKAKKILKRGIEKTIYREIIEHALGMIDRGLRIPRPSPFIRLENFLNDRCSASMVKKEQKQAQKLKSKEQAEISRFNSIRNSLSRLWSLFYKAPKEGTPEFWTLFLALEVTTFRYFEKNKMAIRKLKAATPTELEMLADNLIKGSRTFQNLSDHEKSLIGKLIEEIRVEFRSRL
jgi:tetratricopeptide (TPR) repeat protein